jgi:hypothetical protein
MLSAATKKKKKIDVTQTDELIREQAKNEALQQELLKLQTNM